MTQDSTHWTLIRRAQGEGRAANIALGELLMRYERFITAIIRSSRHPPGDRAHAGCKASTHLQCADGPARR